MGSSVCPAGRPQTPAAVLESSADSESGDGQKAGETCQQSPTKEAELEFSGTFSCCEMRGTTPGYGALHTMYSMHLYAELSGTLGVVPSPPHAVVMVSVAVGDVQLSAHLLLCTVDLQEEQSITRLSSTTAALQAVALAPTSHSGVLSWWMTTLTCWLRAKATMASLPANVPG